jgi:Ca-activated chloride channel family protein
VAPVTVRRKAFLFAFGMAAIATLALPGIAQVVGPTVPPKFSGDPSRTSAKPIRIDVEMVLVNVTVTDSEDRRVMGLQKDNFRLYENDIEQEILTFSHDDTPISIGLLFDMSGSMVDKLDKARQAALQLLKTANPQDEFFLVSFNDRAELTSGFTSNIQELQMRMMSTKPQGHTALLDAIYLGIRQMKSARYRKRALLVISDGGDNHSRYHEARIRNDLREADCQLYAMGIFDDRDMKRTPEERKGPALLSELAGIAGGRAFRVSSLDELPDVAARISMELRDQYVLGYKPGSVHHDGAWRSIKVTVAPPASLPPLHVYARNGYYSRSD